MITGMVAPGKLKAYLKERSFTYKILAEILGIKEQTITQWCMGRNRPRQAHQDVILTLTGIRNSDWLSTEERKYVEGARENIKRLRRQPPRLEPTIRDKVAGRL